MYKGTDPGVTFLEDPLFKPPVLPRMGRDAEEVRKELEEAIKEELEAKERAERKGGEASVSAHLDYKTPFGKIDLHRHTMTGHSTKLISLSWRASEVGGNLRAPHRLYPSARIFSARAPGGTIVVDWSGSMGWHDRDLENAIADIPRLRAVIYSMHREAYGAFRGRSTSTLDAAEARAAYMNKVGKYVARVCILADNGRLSPLPNRGQEPEHTSGNGDADKAALYWATRTSPQPIVWVSDGGVEAETYGNWRACDMLMKRYRIVRVLTIQDAIKYLRGEYITGWTATAATPHRKLRRNSAFIQESKDPSRGYW